MILSFVQGLLQGVNKLSFNYPKFVIFFLLPAEFC